MFYISKVDRTNPDDKIYWVTDMEDGTEEQVTFEQLKELRKMGIRIEGLTVNTGVPVVVSTVEQCGVYYDGELVANSAPDFYICQKFDDASTLCVFRLKISKGVSKKSKVNNESNKFPISFYGDYMSLDIAFAYFGVDFKTLEDGYLGKPQAKYNIFFKRNALQCNSEKQGILQYINYIKNSRIGMLGFPYDDGFCSALSSSSITIDMERTSRLINNSITLVTNLDSSSGEIFCDLSRKFILQKVVTNLSGLAPVELDNPVILAINAVETDKYLEVAYSNRVVRYYKDDYAALYGVNITSDSLSSKAKEKIFKGSILAPIVREDGRLERIGMRDKTLIIPDEATILSEDCLCIGEHLKKLAKSNKLNIDANGFIKDTIYLIIPANIISDYDYSGFRAVMDILGSEPLHFSSEYKFMAVDSINDFCFTTQTSNLVCHLERGYFMPKVYNGECFKPKEFTNVTVVFDSENTNTDLVRFMMVALYRYDFGIKLSPSSNNLAFLLAEQVFAWVDSGLVQDFDDYFTLPKLYKQQGITSDGIYHFPELFRYTSELRVCDLIYLYNRFDSRLENMGYYEHGALFFVMDGTDITRFIEFADFFANVTNDIATAPYVKKCPEENIFAISKFYIEGIDISDLSFLFTCMDSQVFANETSKSNIVVLFAMFKIIERLYFLSGNNLSTLPDNMGSRITDFIRCFNINVMLFVRRLISLCPLHLHMYKNQDNRFVFLLKTWASISTEEFPEVEEYIDGSDSSSISLGAWLSFLEDDCIDVDEYGLARNWYEAEMCNPSDTVVEQYAQMPIENLDKSQDVDITDREQLENLYKNIWGLSDLDDNLMSFLQYEE